MHMAENKICFLKALIQFKTYFMNYINNIGIFLPISVHFTLVVIMKVNNDKMLTKFAWVALIYRNTHWDIPECDLNFFPIY